MSTFEPHRYLTTELPRLLHDASRGVDRSAVIQLSVTDRDDCDVVVTLSPGAIVVTPGLAAESDATLALPTRALERLTQGTVDTDNIRFHGNREVLQWFARLLTA